jgi:hypothetical protein
VLWPLGVNLIITKLLIDKLIRFQIIQRRYNGSLSFERDWQKYKEGFGYPNGEYWLGMDVIVLAFIEIYLSCYISTCSTTDNMDSIIIIRQQELECGIRRC